MAPRMLVLDIDGTTVTKEKLLTEADRLAVERLRTAGVVVALATGRLWSGAQPVYEALALDGLCACMNGSEIIDPATGDRPLRRSLDGSTRQAAQRALDDHHLIPFLFTSDAIVHCERGEPFTFFMQAWAASFNRFNSAFDAPDWRSDEAILAVAAIGDEAGTHGAAEALSHALPPHVETLLYPGREGFWALHLRDRRENKGTALDHLGAPHGIAVDEIVAVGDWLNDLPMLERAGRSFAMGQAPDEVKQAASDVLASTRETGGAVAEVARKVWGIG